MLASIVLAPRVRSALAKASDDILTFALRTSMHVLDDNSRSPRAVIARLGSILDDPEVHKAIGVRPSVPMGIKIVSKQKPRA
jgi:hypothetical protein